MSLGSSEPGRSSTPTLPEAPRGMLAARAGKHWRLLSAQWELEKQAGVRSQGASRAVTTLY